MEEDARRGSNKTWGGGGPGLDEGLVGGWIAPFQIRDGTECGRFMFKAGCREPAASQCTG